MLRSLPASDLGRWAGPNETTLGSSCGWHEAPVAVTNQNGSTLGPPRPMTCCAASHIIAGEPRSTPSIWGGLRGYVTLNFTCCLPALQAALALAQSRMITRRPKIQGVET
jgi:hypothetical protein